MTSKDRVLTTLALNAADRVPVDYSANGGIDRRLKEHFGLKPNDTEALLEAPGRTRGLNESSRNVTLPVFPPF